MRVEREEQPPHAVFGDLGEGGEIELSREMFDEIEGQDDALVDELPVAVELDGVGTFVGRLGDCPRP